jgi:hypothetical protein
LLRSLAGDPAAHQQRRKRYPLPKPAPAQAGVTKRKISGGTRSDLGRNCRDAFLGLAKTCAKLGIAFWEYLSARLGCTEPGSVPELPQLVSAPSRTPDRPDFCPYYIPARMSEWTRQLDPKH